MPTSQCRNMVVPGADSKLSSLSFREASNISCKIKKKPRSELILVSKHHINKRNVEIDKPGSRYPATSHRWEEIHQSQQPPTTTPEEKQTYLKTNIAWRKSLQILIKAEVNVLRVFFNCYQNIRSANQIYQAMRHGVNTDLNHNVADS